MHYNMHKEPEYTDVDLEGDFTYNDSDVFIQIIRAVKPTNDSPSSQQVHFNVSRLERIDAAAMTMILSLLDDAKRNHQSITIMHPHGQVEQKFKSAAQYNNSLMIVQ